MNPLEELGRLYLEHRGLNAEYDRLLEVLQKVAAGEIPPRVLTIDLKARTWGYELHAEDLAPMPE